MGEGSTADRDVEPSNLILGMISDRILQQHNISSTIWRYVEQAFDRSCDSYKQEDIEIGLMLSELELEMNLALKGTLKEYRGELPEWLTVEKAFEIYLQLIKRSPGIA